MKIAIDVRDWNKEEIQRRLFERDELVEERDSLARSVERLEDDIAMWEDAWNDSEQLLIRIGELTHG